MEPTLQIDSVIRVYARDVASCVFDDIAGNLNATELKTVLDALNSLVLMGPAFEMCRSIGSYDDNAKTYFALVAEEIARLQDFPDGFEHYDIKGYVGLESYHFVSPRAAIEPQNIAKVPASLQVCTDCRLIPFARIVAYIISEPNIRFLDWQLPEQQRLLAFAVWAASQHGFKFNNFHLIAELSDPIALVMGGLIVREILNRGNSIGADCVRSVISRLSVDQ